MFSFLKREPGFYGGMFRLSIPIVLQNVINNGLALADAFMVGGLGENELAAVTLANNVFFVLTLMSFGIQSGTAVLISQYWGRGDTKTISRVIGLGLYVSGGISALFAAVVMCFPRGVMDLTTNDPALAAIGAEYLLAVAPAFMLNALALIILSAFRCMENPRVGLLVLTVSMGANTLLNYMLIYGEFGAPALGVRGAALATVISRVIEFVLTGLYLVFNSHFKLKWRAALRPGLSIARDFSVYAVPVIVNETLWGLGFTLYPVIAGHMEGAASGVAAYTVALSVDRILSALFFGAGGAAAILIGKRLGRETFDGDDDGGPAARAGAYDLGKALVTVTGLTGLAAGVCLALAAGLAAVPLLSAFLDMSAETAAMARVMMFINAANMPLRAVNYTVIVGILRGGGDVRAAAVIDVLFLYLVGLPFAWVMGLLFKFGVLFIFIGILIEEFTKLFVCLLRFRKKAWIKNVTREG